MSFSDRGFAWALTILLGALFVSVCTGGTIRSISPVPGDATMRRVSDATWWLTPALVTIGGLISAWTVRASPLLALGVGTLSILSAVLCYRWRPARSDAFWVPVWLIRLRAAVRVPIRDSAAWRRQATCLSVGICALAVSATFG
jgi:hypothetical protein